MAKHYILYDTEAQTQTLINPEKTILVDNIIISERVYQTCLSGEITVLNTDTILDSFSINYDAVNYEICFTRNTYSGICTVNISYNGTNAYLTLVSSNFQDSELTNLTWNVDVVSGNIRIKLIHSTGGITWKYNILRTLYCKNEIN